MNMVDLNAVNQSKRSKLQTAGKAEKKKKEAGWAQDGLISSP